MRRHWFPKPYADLVARLRVPSGFVLVALFVALARPTWASIAAGVPVSAAGLLLRAWAAGHLAKNERLSTTGPYAFVRNPLYCGTLVIATGLLVAARHPLLAVVFAAVFVGVYLPVIELEEQHLRKLFPAYGPYAERVPLVVPRFRALGVVGGWTERLYRKNEEWKALLAYAAALGFLIAKAA
ncbi:MAG TPA: isoprenylcysteine carboxylmethyltransferase family protein [Bryobacteraceae bacterium]|nr:isoprenylcysteine carboxylmethyltransferase family protein [Bryobacteraceae bacterium]